LIAGLGLPGWLYAVIVVVVLALSFYPASDAWSRHRPVLPWLLAGLFLGPVAAVVYLYRFRSRESPVGNL